MLFSEKLGTVWDQVSCEWSGSTDTAEDAILRHVGQRLLRDGFQIANVVRNNQDNPIEFAVYDDLCDTFGEGSV